MTKRSIVLEIIWLKIGNLRWRGTLIIAWVIPRQGISYLFFKLLIASLTSFYQTLITYITTKTQPSTMPLIFNLHKNTTCLNNNLNSNPNPERRSTKWTNQSTLNQRNKPRWILTQRSLMFTWVHLTRRGILSSPRGKSIRSRERVSTRNKYWQTIILRKLSGCKNPGLQRQARKSSRKRGN